MPSRWMDGKTWGRSTLGFHLVSLLPPFPPGSLPTDPVGTALGWLTELSCRTRRSERPLSVGQSPGHPTVHGLTPSSLRSGPWCSHKQRVEMATQGEVGEGK